MGTVEALYIFDEQNKPILEHVYTGRPPSAAAVLPLYLAHASPRPSLMYLATTTPPVILFSIIQDRMLFLSPSSAEIEPLLVIEFLQRVADALEDFLGAPLLPSKIDASFDVVAQIVGEMCDAGVVCNTEPNALREVVEAPTWVGSLLGGFGLPSSSPTLTNRPTTPSLTRPNSPFNSSIQAAPTTALGGTIPWRRSNVRHTSNELYVDIVETLSVIFAPSGRPLSALAAGTIAFTAKLSGVPDLLLTLSAPGGRTALPNAMQLPCFHPCVRLARWAERPGELSFVPPDGRFVLAAYECDLLPPLFSADAAISLASPPQLHLPAAINVRTCVGAAADEFEVLLTLPQRKPGGSASAATTALGSRFGGSGGGSGGAAAGGAAPTAPAVDDIVVTIPLPGNARPAGDLRCTRGEAAFLPAERLVEWCVTAREAAALGPQGAVLRCQIAGSGADADADADADVDDDVGPQPRRGEFDYDDDDERAGEEHEDGRAEAAAAAGRQEARSRRRRQQTARLMPRSACLSFSVKGWLASGLRVESLAVNAAASKGLGAGVTPYKGVKYHTVSRRGVEVRC